jgi:GDP-L-fucose synthase
MKKKVFIAGQEGMVGSEIYDLLKKKKFKLIDCKRKDLDLINQISVDKWFKKNKPDIVINAAGKVGGILDNNNFKDEYIYQNSIMGLNLVNASLKYNVKKFINLGSACIYPKKVKNPIKEEYLLSSNLEKTNEGYAIAKICVLKFCEYIQKRYKKKFISLQPTNLYGNNDNYDLKSSHVIPGLIHKFYLAVKKKKIIEIWGSGSVKREFLHVKDLAEAILFCIKKDIKYNVINIGSGYEITIKELVKKLIKITNYKGKVIFNKKYPDGVKNRKLDSTKIMNLGWKPKIDLDKGLTVTYSFFSKNYKKNNYK